MHEKRGNFCIFLLKIVEKEGETDLDPAGLFQRAELPHCQLHKKRSIFSARITRSSPLCFVRNWFESTCFRKKEVRKAAEYMKYTG